MLGFKVPAPVVLTRWSVLFELGCSFGSDDKDLGVPTALFAPLVLT